MEKNLSTTIDGKDMIRIAITGPESTGKTTLAEELAAYFKCNWVPEYAREYLQNTHGFYTQKDLDNIAQKQMELWQTYTDNNICFYDTEMLVLKIWSSFKYNKVSPFILNAYQKQKIDLMLLCKPDIDWEEDELREHPESREELFAIYYRELEESKFPFKIIEGQKTARIQLAIKLVTDFLENHPLIKS